MAATFIVLSHRVLEIISLASQESGLGFVRKYWAQSQSE
jgi:hypothetical protein